MDCRRWVAQIDTFAQQYRVIAYSRRYNFPNKNRSDISDYSAITDADDLGLIIRELSLGRCHIVAESYGAYAALFLAISIPNLYVFSFCRRLLSFLGSMRPLKASGSSMIS
jgi:pimeloyl-ACP methyl ester carboxylesterase